jgi:hypothetical protein
MCKASSDHQPIEVFVDHHGHVKYLTANKIADVLQSILKECHPDMTRDELVFHFSQGKSMDCFYT